VRAPSGSVICRTEVAKFSPMRSTAGSVLLCSMSTARRPGSFVARAAVSLRGGAPDRSHFLADHDVVIADGVATPIEYGGRRYVFSHTLVAAGYGPDDARDVYVFAEDGPAAA